MRSYMRWWEFVAGLLSKNKSEAHIYSNATADSPVKADHKVKHFPGEALD